MQTDWRIVLTFILGVVVGMGVAQLDLFQTDRATPRVREGYVVWIDGDGTGIALADQPNTVGAGYEIGEAWWRREGEAAWTSSSYPPACVQVGQKTRLGVVQILPNYAPGREVVAWLECLGQEQ